jgi:peroxidase
MLNLSFLKDLEERNADGSGNNVLNVDWGSAHQHYVRVTPASYLNGHGNSFNQFGAPSDWGLPVQNTGLQGIPPSPFVGTLPSARAITNAIMAQSSSQDIPSTTGTNEYFQFFGQFLTHDVAEASLASSGDPPLFVDGLPFPIGRSPFEMIDGVRQQLNDETSYLDLSNVYGNSDEKITLLRDVTAGGDASAKLLMSVGGEILPTYAQVSAVHGRTFAELTEIFDPDSAAPIAETHFLAGDNRVNQQGALISHHVLWAQNHNWHVDQLRSQFPSWSEQDLFEAARALNEAEWQNVVYEEYMGRLIGHDAISQYSGYDATVNASIINEWTTVAFRFGHDESSNDLRGLNEDGSAAFTVTLGQAFALAGASQSVRDMDNLGDWIRGQLARPTQEIDGQVVDGNRNLLFGIQTPNGPATVDLEVFDIIRGRDHGVGNYNKLREGLGLSKYTSFEDFAAQNGLNAAKLAALKDVYGDDIDKMDSIVGGLLEKKATGSQLGETFTILNVLQFEALRDGDRFFYLNRFADHPELIQQIQDTSLAEILVRNGVVDYAYHDAFASHVRIGGTIKSETIRGTDGVDLVIGFAGKDNIDAKKGDDDVYGGDGDDKLGGGAGRDLLDGGNGVDQLYGGADADTLKGGAGKDTLAGDDGNDWLYGDADDDFIYGGAGDDRADGGEGRDTAFGGIGNDRLAGGNGDDKLVGEAGNDILFGGAGKDEIKGDDGNDVLIGGEGVDSLFSGKGNDIFVVTQGSGRDVARDFDKRADKIDVSAYGWDWDDVRGHLKQVGNHLALDFGDGTSLLIEYTLLRDINASHFIYDPTDYFG